MAGSLSAVTSGFSANAEFQGGIYDALPAPLGRLWRADFARDDL